MNSQPRHDLAHIVSEEDGDLGVIEFEYLPFSPKRFFWLKSINGNATRAGHAHRTCQQLLFCLQGVVTATITNGDGKTNVHEMRIGSTIHLEPLHWLELTEFSGNAVLGVFASEPYLRDEYITSKEDLTKLWRLHIKNKIPD